MVCLQKSCLNFKQLQFIAAEEFDYKLRSYIQAKYQISRHLKRKFKPKNETK